MTMKPYTPPVKLYAGIGNRDTPPEFIALIKAIATLLNVNGYTVRTGWADGADKTFINHSDRIEPYIPWDKFEGQPMVYPISKAAFEMAEKYCPHWLKMSKGVRALHARNMMIIAGPHMCNNVEIVVCFTRDGCESKEQRSAYTGGTGSAIAFADDLGIPIVNLATKRALEHLSLFTSIDFMNMELPPLVTPF